MSSEESGSELSLENGDNANKRPAHQQLVNIPKKSKRTDVLNWEDYFMAVAILASQRSKDPKTQVGACIVDKENIIVGVGYNGFPRGCSDEEFPWNREKHNYVCHAEMNAILKKNSVDLRGCKIYATLFPCPKCTICIIQTGIVEVIYKTHKEKHEADMEHSRKMLNAAGIPYRKYVPQKSTVRINLKD